MKINQAIGIMAFVICFSVFNYGCHQGKIANNDTMIKSEGNNQALELIECGFLDYTENSKLDSLKLGLIETFDIYDEDNYRFVPIDAEALVEFQFDSFLPELNRVLGKRKINLSVEKRSDEFDSFEVIINGTTIPLYTQGEIDNNTFGDTGPRNFFKHINGLLKSSGSVESFFLLNGGNDLQVLLLTDKQFSIISDYYKSDEQYMPYVP